MAPHPRTLGQLFFLVYVGAGILFQITHLWVWVALSSVAVAALSITTKFGNQAVVFVSIGLALAGYWVPLATALGGYVLSATVTRGKSIRVLRGQINHSIFYFKHLQKPSCIRTGIGFRIIFGACCRKVGRE